MFYLVTFPKVVLQDIKKKKANTYQTLSVSRAASRVESHVLLTQPNGRYWHPLHFTDEELRHRRVN